MWRTPCGERKSFSQPSVRHNGIPAIPKPLFTSLDDALGIAPYAPETDGRIALFIEAGKKLASEFPEADVRIPVSGPFSIAVSLYGINELCMDVGLRPDDVATWWMYVSTEPGLQSLNASLR